MSQIKHFNFEQSKIDTIIADNYSGNYLWLGFAQVDDLCKLQKVSANNLYQIYYDIDVAITAWKKFFILSSDLYTAIEDDSLIGKKYGLLTPLTSVTDFTKPVGANEVPIDVQVYGSYVYFLLPGNLSGENAKIYKFTTSGTYIETIDLSTIQNASSFVVIDNTNIWLVTHTLPVQLVRIYNDGSWNYSIF